VSQPPDALLLEAGRQLAICNACRYCEGYCAVFPALERRVDFSAGDVTHLANLCHDCRACYYACMYAPPHQFAVNPPAVLSSVRRRSYSQFLGPLAQRVSTRVESPYGVGLLGVVTTAVVTAIAVGSRGPAVLWQDRADASPYRVISYGALVAVIVVPFLLSLVTIVAAAARYWRETDGRLASVWNLRAHLAALSDAGQLRYLQGGGAECYYPDDHPSAARRYLHGLVAYGFSLCLLATVSAAVCQDLLSREPPYGLVSLPVLSGLLGGVALVVGTTGLIFLKSRADPAPMEEPHSAGYGFVVALDVLALTGLATLLARHGTGFGLVLVVHLSAVVVCIVLAPYTKFVHLVYRYLALVKEHLEREAAEVLQGAVA
jgi:citrate/tricarballylate utilization protein